PLLGSRVLAEAAAVVAERLLAGGSDAGKNSHEDGSSIATSLIEPMAVNGSPELLIVMAAGATPDQTEHVLARLQEVGVHARVTRGREATVIGAIGERELLATLPIEGYPGVEQVLPILKPYKLVAREVSPDPTVIEVDGRRLGDEFFGLIAGPCTFEYREQTLATARAVAAAGATMLR